MKIAACDYDGTLFRHGQISRKDLDAIKAWRGKGHLFGIATGRDLNLLSAEIDHYSITVDFAVCSTGASIYDQNLKPLYLVNLPPPAVNIIFDHPSTSKSRYFLISRADRTYIYSQSEKSWLTGLGLPLEYIDEDSARAMSGIQQVGLEYEDQPTAERMTEIYNADFGPAIYAQNSGVCVDLVAGGINKAEGIATFIAFKNLKPEIVITLGDSENDLSMFKRFRGYAMEDSPEILKTAAHAVAGCPADILWANI